MNKDELNQLKEDIKNCKTRFDEAVQNFITMRASPETIEELEKVDAEYKALNQKYWDWIEK